MRYNEQTSERHPAGNDGSEAATLVALLPGVRLRSLKGSREASSNWRKHKDALKDQMRSLERDMSNISI